MKKLILPLLLLSLLVGCQTAPMSGATIASQTFVLPNTPTVTHDTNTYLIIYDIATGNMANASTGAVAAGNTWGNCDIATAVHAQNGQVYTATIPALDNSYRYAMAVFSAASPAKTDSPTDGPWIYDPVLNQTLTDTNRDYKGAIPVDTTRKTRK